MTPIGNLQAFNIGTPYLNLNSWSTLPIVYGIDFKQIDFRGGLLQKTYPLWSTVPSICTDSFDNYSSSGITPISDWSIKQNFYWGGMFSSFRKQYQSMIKSLQQNLQPTQPIWNPMVRKPQTSDLNQSKTPSLSSNIPVNANFDVRQRFNGTAEDLNKNLKGVLAGKGDKFLELQEKYGINAAFLVALVNSESGHGQSYSAKNRNNVAGIMSSESNFSEQRTFNSVDECLETLAQILKNGYVNKGLTSIAQIQKKYCPVGAENDPTGLNKNWLTSVSQLTNQYQIA